MNRDEVDLLTGYQEIGDFLGWTARQAKHRALSGELPTFKFGRTPCARRSTLTAWMARQEAQAERLANRTSGDA